MFIKERMPMINPIKAEAKPRAVWKWLKYEDTAAQLDASIPVTGWVK